MTIPGVIGRAAVEITGENQFTEYIYIRAGDDGTVTLQGSGTAVVTLQVLLRGETTPIDIDTVPANGRYFFTGGGDDWRVGCKTGDYTSGTLNAVIQG